MKLNLWTVGLAAAGLVSVPAMQAADASEVLTAVSSTTLSGYVDASAIWAFGTQSGYPAFPGHSANTGGGRTDGFNLNEVVLKLEKPLDEDEYSAGYLVDLSFGPDNLNTAGTIRQAYVNLHAPVGNGLDIKVGHFNTIVGYEVADSPSNPNFSRSYGFFIEPTSHTGILASYQVCEMVSVSAGIANAYNSVINGRGGGFDPVSESEKTYMGSITINAPEGSGFLEGGSVYLAVVTGDATTTPATGADNTTHYYIGASIPTPIENLSVGAAYDYNVAANDGDAQAIAGYFSYALSDKLTIHERLDYGKGDFGAFGWFDLDGSSNTELFSSTTTLEYALWANVLSRVEFRYETNIGSSDKSFGGKDKGLTLAANVAYMF